MGIGAGITLIVLGLILLLNVVQVDIPWVNEYELGVILTIAGIAAIVLALTVWRNRGAGRTVVERRVEPGLDEPL